MGGINRKNIHKQNNLNSFTTHSLIKMDKNNINNKEEQEQPNKTKEEPKKALIVNHIINNTETPQHEKKEIVINPRDHDRNATLLQTPIGHTQQIMNNPINNPFKPGSTVPAIQKILDQKDIIYRQQQQPQQPQQQQNNINNNLLQYYQKVNEPQQEIISNPFPNLSAEQLQQQKAQCIQTLTSYNQLIQYFNNAGALSAEQQQYLQSLLQNVAIQQQHLHRIQIAEFIIQKNDKLIIKQQIDHHKQLQIQLVSAQQITQNQAVQIAQNLQLHTIQFNQAQQSGNQNAMYVASLQMQQDQQLQQQAATKLQSIVAQLLQIGQILHALHTQQQQIQQIHTEQIETNKPTVNALILHTGQSTKNVNINIYTKEEKQNNKTEEITQKKEEKNMSEEKEEDVHDIPMGPRQQKPIKEEINEEIKKEKINEIDIKPQSRITQWMADWFYNRDEETKSTILRLQKTLRYERKKKNTPKRAAPAPPDVFSNDNRNNSNRYRNNNNRRRGGHSNYHSHSNHNHSHHQQRNYNSRRTHNNYFNQQQNNNNTQQQQQQNNNNNTQTRQKYNTRNRRNYRNNRNDRDRTQNNNNNNNRNQ